MDLTLKDIREAAYWKQADLAYHRARLGVYLWALGYYNMPKRVLEIGTGPLGGVLPLMIFNTVVRRVGIDPAYPLYERDKILERHPGVEYVAEHFEDWVTDEKFDAIFAIDALDHGSMGFQLLPKIAGLLDPGGRFFLHVHLRPKERLNAGHDHSLTVEQLDENLAKTNLVELRRDFYPEDVDGAFSCTALVGVWEAR